MKLWRKENVNPEYDWEDLERQDKASRTPLVCKTDYGYTPSNFRKR